MNAVLDDAPGTLAHIERVLHEHIGLDPTTVGSSLVHRAVQRRMVACADTSVVAYAARLASNMQEIQELVEEVVIPETYFFREPEALDAVAAHVSSAAATVLPIRILSAPCSTGEEPYSIAMALMSAGIATDAFSVDAVDVSFQAVERARVAVYRGASFRGGTHEWRAYFDATPQGFVLHASVKNCVRLAQGNLLDPAFRAPRGTYDIVFCRNLLIYFDTETQARLLGTLAMLLAPDGVLVVGAADSFAVRRAGYLPLPGAERSFLFQHRPAGGPPIRATREEDGPRKRTRLRPKVPRAAVSPPMSNHRPAAGLPAAPAVATRPLAAEIAWLAGQGRLAEAARLGEGALSATDVDAELLAIMGTTYAALKSESQAEACYRRALYLDPTHADALLHLSLLLDQRGEATAASRLRARARRGVGGPDGGAG